MAGENREKPLSPRHIVFIEHYLATFNATQAFEAMQEALLEVSVRDTASAGRAMLRTKAVSREVEKRLKDKAGVTEGRISDELSAIAFSNIKDYVEVSAGSVTIKDTSEIPDDLARAIKSITETKDGGLKIELHDKLNAIEKLSRQYQSFSPKRELSGPGGKDLPAGGAPTLVLFNADDPGQVAAVEERAAADAAKDEEDEDE